MLQKKERNQQSKLTLPSSSSQRVLICVTLWPTVVTDTLRNRGVAIGNNCSTGYLMLCPWCEEGLTLLVQGSFCDVDVLLGNRGKAQLILANQNTEKKQGAAAEIWPQSCAVYTSLTWDKLSVSQSMLLVTKVFTKPGQLAGDHNPNCTEECPSPILSFPFCLKSHTTTLCPKHTYIYSYNLSIKRRMHS